MQTTTHEDRDSDLKYGPWPWMVGMVAGAGLFWLMFALATGFS